MRKAPTKTKQPIVLKVQPPNVTIERYLPLGVALLTAVFSIGGWYFKLTELDRQIQEIRTSTVRQDVLDPTLKGIEMRLSNMETSLKELSIKMDRNYAAYPQQGGK